MGILNIVLCRFWTLFFLNSTDVWVLGLLDVQTQIAGVLDASVLLTVAFGFSDVLISGFVFQDYGFQDVRISGCSLDLGLLGFGVLDACVLDL